MTKQTKNNKNIWSTLAGVAGFLMLFWAVSIGDVREQMPQTQAQTELPSKHNTFALGAGGVALMLGALGWQKLYGKERE